MKWIKALALVFLAGAANAQEQIVPATIRTAPIDWKKTKRSEVAKTGESLSLPFIDDFSVDRFPGNLESRTPLWEQRNATRNNGWGLNPPTFGVVSFDGANAFGVPYSFSVGSGSADTLTSCPLNLIFNPDDGIGLSFYYQPKGNAFFAPSNGDSLFLEFYAPDLDQWFNVWGTNDVSNTTGFTFVYIPIQLTRYLLDGFRFRFRNRASLQGALDTWNVDYVWIDQNQNNAQAINNDVAFVRQEFTFLNELTAMPRDHYAENPAEHIRPAITTLLRNLNSTPRTLEGNKIRILYEGNVVGDYPNANTPAILAGATLEYQHNVLAPPNNIVFDPSLSQEALEYEVQLIHGVADFLPTASNDTCTFIQSFFTHYSYDDGSAEAAYAVPANGGEVALQYLNYKSDSVFALQIYFMPLGFNQANSSFSIRIWEDSGNGPGELLAQATKTLTYGAESYQEQLVYTFEEPVFIPGGSFFVGYRQTNQFEGLRVGLDLNTNSNPGKLFFKETTNWVGTQFGGSVMIHPMFTSNGYEDIVSSNRDMEAIAGLKVYPNPARGFFTVATSDSRAISVRVFDIGGRLVMGEVNVNPGQQVNVDRLDAGLYLVEVSNELGQRSTKKLMVSKL